MPSEPKVQFSPTRAALLLIAIFTFVINCPFAKAQTVVIPHTNRGQYSDNGFHNPGNPNYLVGGEAFFGTAVHQNYFVFDLSGVTQPIASAKLALYVLSALSGPGYNSPDASENYELHDVTTAIATLVAGTNDLAAYTDLGSGVVYGNRAMTAADMGTVVEITLNPAALAALDSATGLIGIGGSLTTLDALANSEFTFGSSGNATDVSELRLTLVPEPFTLSMQLVNGNSDLLIHGATNAVYHVFASTNLQSWEDLGAATQTLAGVYHFVDGPAASRPLRFYRATLP